jgi:phosphohistidine phosphatase
MKTPLQRRITLIRHAKAEDDGVTQDHARRLNARGVKDAAALGEWLKKNQAMPELCICSTAQRTRETLAAFGQNIPTILSDKAYLATTGELMALLQQADDAVTHIALIGHNPGMHQLAATLAGSYAQEQDAEKLMLKFPTSAYVRLEFSLLHWHGLEPQHGHVTGVRFADGEC